MAARSRKEGARTHYNEVQTAESNRAYAYLVNVGSSSFSEGLGYHRACSNCSSTSERLLTKVKLNLAGTDSRCCKQRLRNQRSLSVTDSYRAYAARSGVRTIRPPQLSKLPTPRKAVLLGLCSGWRRSNLNRLDCCALSLAGGLASRSVVASRAWYKLLCPGRVTKTTAMLATSASFEIFRVKFDPAITSSHPQPAPPLAFWRWLWSSLFLG